MQYMYCVRGWPLTYAQATAEKLLAQNELGVLYNSVRHPGGECVAALRPWMLKASATQSGHYQFR